MLGEYSFAVEVVPVTPLTHGAGNDGNEQRLATLEHVRYDPEEGWIREESPMVSGAAFRATLREHAMLDYLELAGLVPGELSKDRARLLFKGGRNDSGGQSVSIDTVRWMRQICPALSVFGAMDGGFGLTGKLAVSPVQVYSDDTVAAGVVSGTVRGLTVTVDGAASLVSDARVHPGVPPIPSALVRTRVQQYRHDILGSPAAAFLSEVKDDKNESMPYSMQAISPGTPMVAELRLRQANDVELAVLLRALDRWTSAGGFLGGGSGAGRGQCAVRVQSVRGSPGSGDLLPPYVRERSGEICAWLREEKKAKPKKGETVTA